MKNKDVVCSESGLCAANIISHDQTISNEKQVKCDFSADSLWMSTTNHPL